MASRWRHCCYDGVTYRRPGRLQLYIFFCKFWQKTRIDSKRNLFAPVGVTLCIRTKVHRRSWNRFRVYSGRIDLEGGGNFLAIVGYREYGLPCTIDIFNLIDTSRVVCGKVSVTVRCLSVCLSVRLSVPSIDHCMLLRRVQLWAHRAVPRVPKKWAP